MRLAVSRTICSLLRLTPIAPRLANIRDAKCLRVVNKTRQCGAWPIRWLAQASTLIGCRSSGSSQRWVMATRESSWTSPRFGRSSIACAKKAERATEAQALTMTLSADEDVAALDVSLDGRRSDQLALLRPRQNTPFVFVAGHGRERASLRSCNAEP
jgi:hypothetical protein